MDQDPPGGTGPGDPGPGTGPGPGAVQLENPRGVPVKAWVRGVDLDDATRRQLLAVASLPIVHGWVAAMPDVHLGKGATVGSVIPTRGAIIPAAVGVDLGCGMMAVRTSLDATRLPDDLSPLRAAIEEAVPVGFDDFSRRRGHRPRRVDRAWKRLAAGFEKVVAEEPELEERTRPVDQLGTLGGGNHFLEVCLDQEDRVWIMLHSGSRGVGNRIGTLYIEKARRDMGEHLRNLPDRDLAYLEEGSRHFRAYVEAVHWAQEYARQNRETMMEAAVEALSGVPGLPAFTVTDEVVNCHHNYVAREEHLGQDLWITRKGAIRAGPGELGIIPGSMGAASFVVRGRGNPESFHSSSHGAGRRMSRGEAKRRFSVEDHRRATRGIECRKDSGVIDETPAAYKDIEAVMAAQADLVETVHRLRQVVCVKG